jgi:uncharacterized membrane protein YfcA
MNHIAGFLAGLTASMGLGGGFILIIYLSVFKGAEQSAAGGVNLLFFLPIAFVSSLIHLKNNLIEKTIIPAVCLAGSIGAAGGVLLMKSLDESVLRKLFAALLIIVGLREILRKKVPPLPSNLTAPTKNR